MIDYLFTEATVSLYTCWQCLQRWAEMHANGGTLRNETCRLVECLCRTADHYRTRPSGRVRRVGSGRPRLGWRSRTRALGIDGS